MRSSLKVISAVVPAIASALILPEAWAPPGERAQISRGPNPNDPSHARFSVRCPGCLQDDGGLHDDLHLDFNITALASSELCGYGNITVNEHLLPQESTTFSSHGRGLVPATSINRGIDHTLAAEWEFSCLVLSSDSRDHNLHGHGDGAQAQFLTFTVREIDGQSLPGGTVGFTVSYNQSIHPQLLRVESGAYPVPDTNSIREWLSLSSSDESVEVPAPGQNAAPESSIDLEMRELHRLKAEAEQLRLAIKEQKRVVWRLFKAELKGLRSQITQCKDMSCVIDVASRKAGWAIRTIYGGFRPMEESHPTSSHDEERTRWRWWWNHPWGKHGSSEDLSSSSCSPLHSNSDRAQAGLSLSDTGCAVVDGHDSVAQEATEPNSRHEPHAWESTYQQEHHSLSLAFVLGHILAFVIFPASVVILILRRCLRRRRKENRSAVVSRHAADVVRRAQRRRGVRKWWTSLWLDPRIMDYEEKRALVLEQERILELAMHDEIRELRSAAETVSSLVNGDDGRVSAPSMRGIQPVLSRRDSLPDYRSEASYGEPPPTYDDSNDYTFGEVVADGFQYGGRLGSNYMAEHVDWSPDSSVVGTSVRGDISSDDEAL